MPTQDSGIVMAAGSLKRVVAFRLKKGEDLLKGIEKVCERYGIRHGAILSGIGSLDGARFCDVEALPNLKAGYGYSDPIVLTQPIELLAASGAICEGPEGEVLLHVHCCFSDKTGHSYGGHLIEGNTVLMTSDFVIGEFEGISMDRRFDEDLGVYIVNPRQL